MSAAAPEQMRALAAHHQSDVDYYGYSTGSLSAKTAAALRAAADQLEAVRRIVEDYDEDDVDGRGLSDALEAVLTADTAPQEDRDE